MNKSDNIEQQARNMLDDSVEKLNPDISRRLQLARYAVLEKAKSKQIKKWSVWSFYPQAMTAMLAIAVLSVSIWFNAGEKEFDETILAMDTEIEMLTANDSLELMEDLEFIQWLVETEEHAS